MYHKERKGENNILLLLGFRVGFNADMFQTFHWLLSKTRRAIVNGYRSDHKPTIS
jgi:hypothetical protein